MAQMMRKKQWVLSQYFLVAEGYQTPWARPAAYSFLVIISCAAAIWPGTFFGGWRIVKTMAQRSQRLRPLPGFFALKLQAVLFLHHGRDGNPCKHNTWISSSYMGVESYGITFRRGGGGSAKIVGAWVLTIPMAAIISASVYLVMKAIY